MKKDPILVFACLVAGLMVYATLYPFHFSPHHTHFLDWNSADSRSSWLDVMMNLYFFMPLGLLLGIRYRTSSGFLACLIGCGLISASVEVAQAYIPGRHSSLRDVFLNSIGAFLGMLAAHLPVFDRALLDRRIESLLKRRGELILVSLYCVFQFFPFIPILRITKLIELRDSISVAEWITLGTLEATGFAFLLSFVVQNEESRFANLWVPVGFLLATPLQAFLWGRPAEITQLLVPMLGFGIAIGVIAAGITIPARALAAMGLGLLVIRQLQPFHWEWDSVHRMEWLPLRATFEVSRDISIRTLALKCFLYWYVLRQCRIAFEVPVLRVALGLAAFLLATELGQVYQPTRTPEITDPLLALMGSLPFLAMGSKTDQGL